MQLYMRLLYPADIDLILMRLSMGRRFTTFIKQCLRSKIYGRKFEYIPPASSSFDLSEMNTEYPINMALDEVYDSDIISFISCFPKRARSPVIVRIMHGCSTRFPEELFAAYVKMQTEQQTPEVTADKWNEDLMIADETGIMGPNRIKPKSESAAGSHKRSGTRAKTARTDNADNKKATTRAGTKKKAAETSEEETKPQTTTETSEPSDFDFDETLQAFSRLSMGNTHSLASAVGNITPTSESSYEGATEQAGEHGTHELHNEQTENSETKHVSRTENGSITETHKKPETAVRNGFDNNKSAQKLQIETETSEQHETSEPSDFDFDDTLLAFVRLSTGGAHSLASSVGNITPTSEQTYERHTEQENDGCTYKLQSEREENQETESVSQPDQSIKGLEKTADTESESITGTAYQEPETDVQNSVNNEITKPQQNPAVSEQPEPVVSFDFDDTLLAFARLSSGDEHSLASSVRNITPTSEPEYEKPIEPPETQNTNELQNDNANEHDAASQPTAELENESNAEIEANTKKEHETDVKQGFDVGGFGEITQDTEDNEETASENSKTSEMQTAQTEAKKAGKKQEDDIDEDDMMSMFTQMMNH